MRIIAMVAILALLCGCIGSDCPKGQEFLYEKGCVNESQLEMAKTVNWEQSSSTEVEKIYLPVENVTCFSSQVTFSCVVGKR